MKYPNSKMGRSAKTGQFVLSSDHGAKITAVVGMKLTPRMAARLHFDLG